MASVTCPVCGGYIVGAADDGYPCSCAPRVEPDPQAKAKLKKSLVSGRAAQGIARVSDPEDTDTGVSVSDAPVSSSNGNGNPAPAPGPAKVCCVCGIDVSKSKRFRDERGYWCASCSRDDLAKRKASSPVRDTKEACPDCGRKFDPQKLVVHELTRVCPSCFRTRQTEGKRKRLMRFDFGGSHEREERRRLVRMLIVAGVLLLIAMWQWLF